jgi:hypothetical protein
MMPMNILNRRALLKLSAAACLPLRAQAPQHGIMQSVLRRGYDLAGSGCNSAETILTQANVAKQGIRLLYFQALEGDARGAESAPLVVPSVPMRDGATRDIVIVSTMNNRLICFDANNSDEIWSAKLAVPVNGGPSIDSFAINDHWGCLSTGVIDPIALRWYGVAWTAPDGVPQNAHHVLYTIDITNGNLLNAASLAGVTYQPPNGLPLQTFGSTMRKQRSSLLLLNGVVFFASGTVLETSKVAAGWVMAYDTKLQKITAAISLACKGWGAGVWMAGSGISADSAGNLYLVTGNGSFDGITDYGECALKLRYMPPISTGTGGGAINQPASLSVIDWFCPWTDSGRIDENPTQATPTAAMIHETKLAGISLPSKPDLDEGKPVNGRMAAANPDAGFSDEDLGSAPGLLIEELGMYVVAGKDSIAYVVNSKSMGQTRPADLASPAANYAKLIQPPIWYGTYDPSNPAPPNVTALDIFPGGKTRHMHSASVKYNSPVNGLTVFCAGENSPIRAWKATAKGLSYMAASNEISSAQATGPHGGMSGAFMSVSCNGTKAGTGLLWAVFPYTDSNTEISAGRLVVYDADHFEGAAGNGVLKILWDSQQWGVQLTFNKFLPPVISGGRCFYNSYNGRLLCLGLA